MALQLKYNCKNRSFLATEAYHIQPVFKFVQPNKEKGHLATDDVNMPL